MGVRHSGQMGRAARMTFCTQGPIEHRTACRHGSSIVPRGNSSQTAHINRLTSVVAGDEGPCDSIDNKPVELECTSGIEGFVITLACARARSAHTAMQRSLHPLAPARLHGCHNTVQRSCRTVRERDKSLFISTRTTHLHRVQRSSVPHQQSG